MSLRHDEKLRADDALLEELLRYALKEPRIENSDQLDSLFQKLKDKAGEPVAEIAEGSLTSITGAASRSSRRSSNPRKVVMAMFFAAATIILAVTISSVQRQHPVISAQQVLNQIINTPVQHRTYDVALVTQIVSSEQRTKQSDQQNPQLRTINGKLYVNDRDLFAVELSGWLGIGTWWVGGNSNERWIVPPVGPAIVGRESLVGAWLTTKDASARFLSLKSVLQQMSEAYDLEQLADGLPPEQILPTQTPCYRIVGTRYNKDDTLRPIRIELWADKDSGLVRRIDMQWNRSKVDFGPVRWTIRLSAKDNLSNSIFSPQAHTRPNQRTLNVKNSDELSELDASF